MKNLFIMNLCFMLLFVIPACQEKKQNVITFKENGSWCWFQDERAIIYNNQLIFGSVADRYGKDGKSLNGNIEVTSYNLETNTNLGTFILHEELEADDHNVPALQTLQNGRLLCVYSKHNTDSLIRYRISKNADLTKWEPEKTINGTGGITYSNLHFLQSENNGNGRIYNFYRGANRTPYYIFSDDQSGSWQAGYNLIWGTRFPYLKYASDGKSRIHFITTESHPVFMGCSIYHGFIENEKVYGSNGTLIRALKDGPIQSVELTNIFQGDTLNNAWTIDLHLDQKGRPYIAYSVRKDIDHIHYRYAKWNGYSWSDHFLAFAGRALYEGEFHYSGLVALDPDNPDVVYISTDVDPLTEAPLISSVDHVRHYEIFRGTSTDSGQTWAWEPLTQNSNQDNVRPIMPIGNDRFKVVLWLRGSIKSYTDYNFDVVGMINP